MKNSILIVLVLSVVFLPALVRADALTYQEAWIFHYEFALSGQYHIVGGPAVLPAPGTWKIEILSQAGDVLSTTQFQPGGATQTIQVPYQDRGYNARIVDARGATQLLIGLAGSRTCDDNGVCNADQGENADNCPTDCGTGQVAQQAAIGHQSALPGGMLLVLADILILGVVVAVDRRRRS